MAQHLSIRVPWHDSGYCGKVCNNPGYNNSCLRLKGISEKRDDDYEMSPDVAGSTMAGIEQSLPCISEGGAFMSDVELVRTTTHPYKDSNPNTHGHFLETEIHYKPYSLPARPFRWMMKNDICPKYSVYNIDYDEEREPKLKKFNSVWIQDAKNHKGVFDYFYHDVIPNKSLCLIYAKQVPFVEDPRRIIIGIGFVEKITPAVEHNHTEDGSLRSLTWETMLSHSIRKNNSNGFLFPYLELMKYADNHPDFDIRKATVFAPDGCFEEFSYATEHLSYDAVIDVLLQSLKTLNVIKGCVDGDWDSCINWVNSRLTEVWQDRGAYPNIGGMLCVSGFRFGLLIAEELKNTLKEGEDIWEKLDNAISNPNQFLSPEIAKSITKLNQQTWSNLKSERRSLFMLLSRFSLTLDQSNVLFNEAERRRYAIECSDKEIIENPYVLYEKTRNQKLELKIPLNKVDRAVFPPLNIREKYPLTKPSCLSSDNDERRIRAIAISILENQAEKGHTIYPCNNLINDMNDLPIVPKCNVTQDVLSAINCYLSEEVVSIKMKNDGNAYKLTRINKIDELIKQSVFRRVNATKRHNVDEDWRTIIDDVFGKSEDKKEEMARQEKASALKELAEARLSVLLGGAGTGKTTLLSLLCSSEKIKNGGVLLLAPTGKARVKMTQAMKMLDITCQAKTVAQFLLKSHRYDGETGNYSLSDIAVDGVPETVIIDESSMLTEEMFGALLQALRPAGRIIFVGDLNQLPPIGAGRPFVDLVRLLCKDIEAKKFPVVTASYAELTVSRRQKASDNEKKRLDSELSKWYVNGPALLDEEVFEKLQGNLCDESISFKMWKTNEELEQLILDTLKEELKMKDVDDVKQFDHSLGGNVTSNGTYFNIGCAKEADNWQILAPVRGMPHGVININHLIHNNYRKDFMDLAKRKFRKKIHTPLGSENIVYGDKVINLLNKQRRSYPRENSIDYVANGEIGIATSGFGNPTYFNVEFSSQKGFTYSYDKSHDFGEETESALELAYALTVHKAQGSEFKKVILVISEPCNLISKELLYTAITRQTERLVILYNQEAYNLRNYSSLEHSDIARRFTDLFEIPEIVIVNDKYYENGLIHKTTRGELVRSKSEVIIANMLYGNKIVYEYERKLRLDNTLKIPDFTIDDQESGEIFYWEHCGMMTNEEYKKGWENKKYFYEKHGIIEDVNLIVTYDEDNGAINSETIQKKIDKYLKKDY